VGFEGSAKASLENLHFTQSGYSYTVYRESAAFDTNGAGVRVKTPDGKSSRLPCNEDSPPSDLYVLRGLGLRVLPEESLVSVEDLETWPAESASADLLQGVRTHDFALVTKALNSDADANFHGPNDVGVLGALVDRRAEAISRNRVREFDEETDRLLELLLSRGASPTISTANGATPINFLAKRAPDRAVRRLLDAGWPKDPQYRLYVGALLGDSALVKEALDYGAYPNIPVRGVRIIVSAISRASELSVKGMEAEQEQALSTLERLLTAGAQIDEGTRRSGGGDIVKVYAHAGTKEHIRPVLDLLIRYASPAARENALYWLRLISEGNHPKREANLDWLISRLEH
jgi:hypothetical protein